MLRLTLLLSLFWMLCLLVGCSQNSKGSGQGNNDRSQQVVQETGPVEKPEPPFQISVPADLPTVVKGQDIKPLSAEELLVLATQAMETEDYPNAAIYQYWYVKKSGKGQYNLACFLARTNQNTPAVYWLQLAAIEEGVDAEHAKRDRDLFVLQREPRWTKLIKFLMDYNKYYVQHPLHRTPMILPRGYHVGTPIPVVLWLHGLGSEPEAFVDADCQPWADQLNIAFIGVSGTYSRGPHSFSWAEDPAVDAQRLKDALKECSSKVTIKKGQVITLGFSQGAQVGLDVAVRAPEDYAGSIVLSPGAVSHLESVKPSALLAKRGFVLSCGGQEHPGNVTLTLNDTQWLRKANAKIIHKAYEGVAAHAFPQDFVTRFPEWVKFIRDAQKE